jgi:hypothetical protein
VAGELYENIKIWEDKQKNVKFLGNVNILSKFENIG